jgi:hypothetical protein
MLLFVNLVLGIISRVAQQMNVFAIGFPITLGVGLVGVLLTLPMMQAPFTMALERCWPTSSSRQRTGRPACPGHGCPGQVPVKRLTRVATMAIHN